MFGPHERRMAPEITLPLSIGSLAINSPCPCIFAIPSLPKSNPLNPSRIVNSRRHSVVLQRGFPALLRSNYPKKFPLAVSRNPQPMIAVRKSRRQTTAEADFATREEGGVRCGWTWVKCLGWMPQFDSLQQTRACDTTVVLLNPKIPVLSINSVAADDAGVALRRKSLADRLCWILQKTTFISSSVIYSNSCQPAMRLELANKRPSHPQRASKPTRNAGTEPSRLFSTPSPIAGHHLKLPKAILHAPLIWHTLWQPLMVF